MADVAGSVQTPIEAIWRKQVASFERNRQEQHREAIKEWQLQQEENPRNPESYIQLARHHQQLGEYKKALEVVERGLHVCAPSSRLYRFAVMSLAESNRTKEAIQTARIAAGAVPRRGALLQSEGQAPASRPLRYGRRNQLLSRPVFHRNNRIACRLESWIRPIKNGRRPECDYRA